MSFIFELLFKYRPYLYQKGSISFRPLWPWYVNVLVAMCLLAAAVWMYRTMAARLPAPSRTILAVLRSLSFLIMLLLLLQPVLILYSAIPQRNFVAIAYDASRSMTLKDGPGGRTRFEQEKGLLDASPGGLVESLERRFKLRFFSFAANAERRTAPAAATPVGSSTSIVRSLDQIAQELEGVPVSGIVILTDGAETHGEEWASVISRLKARRIPVFPVGIGSSRLAPDAEIERVDAPKQVLRDSIIEVDAAIRATGLAGRRVKLQAQDGDRVLQTREVVLGGDGEVRNFRIAFASGPVGERLYSIRLALQPGEAVQQNNERKVAVRVLEEQPQILYIEGEPRWIFAFIRRAGTQDKNLRLVSILRQADGKLLRQGIESPTVLEKGFPTDKKELFRYKAIIIGNVEASYFSYDQLRIISEFVSQRGGGVLFLGGRKSYSQGGYAGTPLAEAFPVTLEAEEASGFEEVEYRARLTTPGQEHPATRIALEEGENSRRWTAAPAMFGLNRAAGLRAGASSLLMATVQGRRDELPLLAFQRYGKGKTLALTTDSTWRWRMGLDHRDNFHDVFWRQTLRWLISDAPDSVSVFPDKSICGPDEAAELRAEIYDETFVPLNNANVRGRIKAPSGKISEVSLAWDPKKDGTYAGFFKPEENGLHEVSVDASSGARIIGSARASFRAGEVDAEFFNAQRNDSLLRRLAQETGGRYYLADDTRTLAEDVSVVEHGSSRLEIRDLWDMPFLFILLAGSIAAEWGLRRKKGLA